MKAVALVCLMLMALASVHAGMLIFILLRVIFCLTGQDCYNKWYCKDYQCVQYYDYTCDYNYKYYDYYEDCESYCKPYGYDAPGYVPY